MAAANRTGGPASQRRTAYFCPTTYDLFLRKKMTGKALINKLFVSKYLLWAVLVGVFAKTEAQDTLRPTTTTVGGQFLHGFIIAHSPELVPISQSHPQGVELSLDWLRTSQTAWQRCHCFARSGVLVQYVNFNNPAVLGSAWSGMAYFEPILFAKNRLELSLRSAAGLSYLTRVYDAQTNPKNTFFSSPVSALLSVQFKARLRVSTHLALTMAAQYAHISNGGLRLPNRGMNFPMVAVGINYNRIQPRLPSTKNFVLPPPNLHWRVRMLGYVTAKVLEQSGVYPQQILPLYGAQVAAIKPLTRLYAIQMGIEAKLHDGFARASLARQNQTTDHRAAALLLGHELQLGYFRFGQQFGLYVYNPSPTAVDNIYHRHSLLWRSPKGWLLGVSLQAHRQVAEAFDLRVGKEW